MNVRKRLAGLLIRTAHRIYRPTVTNYSTARVIVTDPKNGKVIVGAAGGGGGAGGSTTFGPMIRYQ